MVLDKKTTMKHWLVLSQWADTQVTDQDRYWNVHADALMDMLPFTIVEVEEYDALNELDTFDSDPILH